MSLDSLLNIVLPVKPMVMLLQEAGKEVKKVFKGGRRRFSLDKLANGGNSLQAPVERPQLPMEAPLQHRSPVDGLDKPGLRQPIYLLKQGEPQRV